MPNIELGISTEAMRDAKEFSIAPNNPGDFFESSKCGGGPCVGSPCNPGPRPNPPCAPRPPGESIA